MISFLKNRNRTLLELWTGIVFGGIICEVIGAFFTKCQWLYAASLWLGIAMALCSSVHMYKSLDKALDYDEGTAKKKIYASYYIRYAVIVAAFAVLCITDFFNPLIAFLGYMMLKVGALIQPFTHKIYNKIFHETDPVPLSEEELAALEKAREEVQDSSQEEASEDAGDSSYEEAREDDGDTSPEPGKTADDCNDTADNQEKCDLPDSDIKKEI